jgi:uncharacterized protein Smg (DUF494 family)
MALQRYWYIDRGQGGRDRLAIVEKANSQTTKETITTDWSSVSEVKDLRVYTVEKHARSNYQTHGFVKQIDF